MRDNKNVYYYFLLIVRNRVGKSFLFCLEQVQPASQTLQADLIGSLSSDVFERRTSTGSEPFSLLISLDATIFLLPSVLIIIKTICPKICSETRLKSAKSPLPVDVRRSKRSLLKLPNNRTGTSVDDGARKSNNWLDQWLSGKLGTGSRVQSFSRALPSSNDVPVLLLNQPNNDDGNGNRLVTVSNVCEAAPKSLFRTPGLNELPEEFPFILIDKSTMAFLRGQNKDFGAVLQTNLTRVSFRLRRRLEQDQNPTDSPARPLSKYMGVLIGDSYD